MVIDPTTGNPGIVRATGRRHSAWVNVGSVADLLPGDMAMIRARPYPGTAGTTAWATVVGVVRFWTARGTIRGAEGFDVMFAGAAASWPVHPASNYSSVYVLAESWRDG